jgi:hypothetical protein
MPEQATNCAGSPLGLPALSVYNGSARILQIPDDKQSQLGKFQEAARTRSDEDEAHWKERLRKIVKSKPEQEKSE